MEYTTEKYTIKLIDAEDNSCRIELFANNEHKNALLKERRKIYIIHSQTEILYVGEANSSIKIRFQRGCTSFNYYKRNNEKARNGYQGYKWLNKDNNKDRNLNVSTFIFNNSYDDNRHFIQAIEGELVYLVREKFGYWPKFQNEIHFNNQIGSKEIAENIFNSTLLLIN